MRCKTHHTIFDCERTILNSTKGKSWDNGICADCSKKITMDHLSKRNRGRYKISIPIVIKSR